MTVGRPCLPIDQHLDAILNGLDGANCVLIEAPPGTGKTTRVAPALVGLGGETASRSWTAPRRVLLIQPRRIAAKASAGRIAAELGQEVGRQAGYHIRFDRQLSGETKILCMTPGILLRRLQNDPILEDVSAVILDEFHERSVDYDLLLGMLRRIQVTLREDLKLVIMSATIDSTSILEYLPEVKTVRVAAQTYPVQILHAKFSAQPHVRPGQRITEGVSDAIVKMASSYEGDVLAFLPGAGEIHQVAKSLSHTAAKHQWNILPLYGSMRVEDQEMALAASPLRKIVLATNIAETSLTIDGVRIVVDSGYARVQRVDPATGLNRLMLEPISAASADQRTGRAGRTASGVCYRNWDEITGRSRAQHTDPEVLRVDLTAACLQLLCWGESDLQEFPWLTSPTQNSLESALAVLETIGAIHDGRPTPLGRTLVKMPLQPRLARLLLEGDRLGIAQQAARVGAILSERDILERSAVRGNSATGLADSLSAASSECDLMLRLAILEGKTRARAGLVNRNAATQIERAAKQLLRELPKTHGDGSQAEGPTDASAESRLHAALLKAFPDRLARRRSVGSNRGVMVGGRGVQLAKQSSVRRSEFFLCLDVDASRTEVNVRLASGVDPEQLVGPLRSIQVERFFNPTLGAVVSRERDCWCDLVLQERPVETPLDSQTAQLLAKAAAAKFRQLLPKSKPLLQLMDRIAWLAQELPEAGLPTFSEQSCVSLLENWCYGLRSLDELRKLPWESLIPSMLESAQRRQLDKHAPPTIALPRGRMAALEYVIGKPPVLAARIQELFGWKETPRLAGGKIPLLLHLLAPNGRVHQITDDLASFWENTYPSVRKELRGRYPKHAWPESPLETQGK